MVAMTTPHVGSSLRYLQDMKRIPAIEGTVMAALTNTPLPGPSPHPPPVPLPIPTLLEATTIQGQGTCVHVS